MFFWERIGNTATVFCKHKEVEFPMVENIDEKIDFNKGKGAITTVLGKSP